MRKLTEQELSKLQLNRLKNIRTGILSKIQSYSGNWCCEGRCYWVENKTYANSIEEKEDYAYRDLVNKYYDKVKVA